MAPNRIALLGFAAEGARLVISEVTNRHVAQTLTEAGVDPWMSDASVLRQAWAGAHPAIAQCRSLPELLATLRRAGGAGHVPAC